MKPRLRVALVCSALLVVALAGVSAAAAAAEPRRPLLALVGSGTNESLVKVDPVSLRRLPGLPKVYVGLHDIPHSFSPDGSLLALGSGRTSSLVIVDARQMRRLAKFESDFTAAITWISGSRLVVVESRWAKDELVLVANIVRVGQRTRVIARHALPTEHLVIGFGQLRRTAVLLLAPSQAIGHTTLAVVTESGVRAVALTEIPAGAEPPDLTQEQPIGRYAYPALAVDADTGRAYVVSGEERVATIDLASLAVVYHDLGSPRQAAASADGGGIALGEGYSRDAAWLGDRRLAVTGRDEWTEVGPDGRVQRSAAVGLRLVDTGDWSEVVLDEQADWFAWSGSFLASSSEPRGLSVYASDGTLQFRRSLPPAGFQLSGKRAYLTLGNEYRAHRVRVVELGSGRALRTVRVPGWFYPLSRAVPDSCWC